MSNFLTALAVGWAITSAVIVGVYLYRYARDWAEDRRREQEYADAWCATHLKHQHDRHDHADERKPE